jgi:hypothetical protein
MNTPDGYSVVVHVRFVGKNMKQGDRNEVYGILGLFQEFPNKAVNQ